MLLITVMSGVRCKTISNLWCTKSHKGYKLAPNVVVLVAQTSLVLVGNYYGSYWTL